ncbi:hypothetical protein CLOSTASPAR_04942 [[Clostridium] asparagiforme DSM 15981]|uniref:Uncharacterized protein n=1 Tax=[Clostridium] asparagiforme DSM 15981 TaxID=518636 RepID=C0D6P6_9FIRM|nr:hypothetical protein CLOSTASPAR_04942 [[Clostridium] asparagiforme DSM 15981]
MLQSQNCRIIGYHFSFPPLYIVTLLSTIEIYYIHKKKASPKNGTKALFVKN